MQKISSFGATMGEKWLFEVFLDTTGPTSGPPSDFSRAGLGSCDTPLEPYGRWLQEYALKSRSRPGFERARAR